MSKRGKKYSVALEGLDLHEEYSLPDGIALVKKIATTKFDGSLEGHFNTSYKNIQEIRGAFQLPHGSGKTIKVLVFAKGEKATEAEEAGADYVGDDDFIKKIEGGWIDFQFIVSTPDMMKSVGKLGHILGKRGLMPKPKSGTVTLDISETIKRLKSGWLEYKADKSGVIHMGMGKLSFLSEDLFVNAQAAYQAVMKDKPSGAKGQYVSSFFLSGTMTPSVKVDLRNIQN